MKPLHQLSIGIASDHAGYELKQKVAAWLEARNASVYDYGTHSTDSCDYADYAHPLADSVEKGECQVGIAICGSGEGMAITLNKHQGIRASLCWRPEIAEITRKHNKANILVLPSRFITEQDAKTMLDRFFDTDFEGGRHSRRIQKIPVR